MFKQTLRLGFVAVVAAGAMAGLVALPAAAADPDPGPVRCRLVADVVVAPVDTTVLARGIGAVACPAPVYQINVAVELTQDGRVVARNRDVCQGQARCRVEAVAANPPGVQVWCAVATGSYALSPSGPVIDLGSQRVCQRG